MKWAETSRKTTGSLLIAVAQSGPEPVRMSALGARVPDRTGTR
ncbi:hypothetical protein [Bhargavaea cecembensis]|nr:hypothetical protein [Bhargavaea cecembensis]